MTWSTHWTNSGRRTRHALAYDPRRDVDHVCPFAITRCGLEIDPGRLIIGWGKICRTCARLEDE